MEITIKNSTARALKEVLKDKITFSYGVTPILRQKQLFDLNVTLTDNSEDYLKKVLVVLEEEKETSAKKIKEVLNILKNVENKNVRRLEQFIPAFEKFILETKTQPWFFSIVKDHNSVAYCLLDIDLIHGRDSVFIRINLGYNNFGDFKTRSIHIDNTDLSTPIATILLNKGLCLETESMLEDYAKYKLKFENTLLLDKQQFLVRKEANQVGTGNWWDNTYSSSRDLTVKGKPSKAILDVSKFKDNLRDTFYSNFFEKDIEVPSHPVLPFFSLIHHSSFWVNIINCKNYVYEENVKEKLVLPESHSQLIDALVANLDVLKLESEVETKSRIIRAKASSSIIICSGPPGTGKTLTAEVYAESIKKPLYEVNSGQLGEDAETIETNLTKCLNRAIHFGIPMLINEADTFIQSRGDSLAQNAVVSVFLRLLEYHNGLVFLTTNRSNIDDAILSRAIAEIKYTHLETTDIRKRVWRSTVEEFNRELSEKDLNLCAQNFVKITGRDILNVVRLTSRVCEANGEKFNYESLVKNSVFKGLTVSKDLKTQAVN